MIPRLLESALRKAAEYYPVLTVTGPRQSGKTTLVQAVWPEKAYASLEDPDVLDFAREDPRAFLEQGGEAGLIVDEAQRDPALFNYLQGYADRSKPGRFVISGSNNFLLMEKISQSLAGRTAVLVLMPFSGEEIGAEALGSSWEEAAWRGFYPRVRSGGLPADTFAKDYVATYVERDLRLVKNVSDLSAFRGFLELCAGRAGQLVNLSALGADAGIAVNTTKEWLSLLETSWLVMRLQPWHENLSKRIVKSPKLYWFDTSLLCHLLGIRKPEDLRYHPQRGAIFENLIVAERYKAASHRGLAPKLHFWRDSNGKEVDLIEGLGADRLIWECKAGASLAQEFFRGLEFFGTETGIPAERRILAYGGREPSTRSAGRAVGWRQALGGMQ
ncbi:MAG: ATP-binding protein [Spirochaetaceae bacterium]|nr:ATP-binding protein [Spirochaetaceae bacterium]